MSTESILYAGILTAILMLAASGYFRVARNYQIVDRPNARSSHNKPVIRGGGIIFIIALLCWFVFEGFPWPWFMLGITAATVISFMDDVKSQPPLLRFLIHLTAFLLLFYAIHLFSWPIGLWLLALIVCIGALNAFNFMDGINGITGIYALVMLLTFGYIHEFVITFTSERFIITNILAVAVFLFFNFRKRAMCFAGDVGSVTMAFVLIFLLLQLIYATENLYWVLLFLIYGIDSVITIVYRLKRRENIFQPHRTHLYQHLCNEHKWPHRRASVLYGVAQAMMNMVLIYAIIHNQEWIAVSTAVGLLFLYLAVRSKIVASLKTTT